jgi:hypothetical protein
LETIAQAAVSLQTAPSRLKLPVARTAILQPILLCEHRRSTVQVVEEINAWLSESGRAVAGTFAPVPRDV